MIMMKRRRGGYSGGPIARNGQHIHPDLPLTLRVYLAGLFDGEGSISIQTPDPTHNFWRADVSISGTKGDAFNALYTEAGCLGSLRVQKRKNPKHKPLWTWSMRNSVGEWFLWQILPWLRIRRAQAEIYLQLREVMRRGRPLKAGTTVLRLYLWKQLKNLNRRGVDDQSTRTPSPSDPLLNSPLANSPI